MRYGYACALCVHSFIHFTTPHHTQVLDRLVLAVLALAMRAHKAVRVGQ
jgi:hypothetical protein